MEPFRGDLYWADHSDAMFNDMIAALSKLNVKYLQQLLSDLKAEPIRTPFKAILSSHKRLISSVEHLLFERTMLK